MLLASQCFDNAKTFKKPQKEDKNHTIIDRQLELTKLLERVDNSFDGLESYDTV